jgi:hypothetical protein
MRIKVYMGPAKVDIWLSRAAKQHLPRQPLRLRPPNDTIDALAFPLTHSRVGMTSRATIHGAIPPSEMWGDIWSHAQRSKFSAELWRIAVLTRPRAIRSRLGTASAIACLLGFHMTPEG